MKALTYINMDILDVLATYKIIIMIAIFIPIVLLNLVCRYILCVVHVDALLIVVHEHTKWMIIVIDM